MLAVLRNVLLILIPAAGSGCAAGWIGLCGGLGWPRLGWRGGKVEQWKPVHKSQHSCIGFIIIINVTWTWALGVVGTLAFCPSVGKYRCGLALGRARETCNVIVK